MHANMNELTFLALNALLMALASASANAETPQKAKAESLQAWREARFGMFIHGGRSC